MDLQLKGMRALITGSSAEIGEAVARILAAEGESVVVHGRHEERAKAVVKAIGEAGGKADIAVGDLGTNEGAAPVSGVRWIQWIG